jgi:pimeloyl-ACP methyl ester carboxylesterase
VPVDQDIDVLLILVAASEQGVACRQDPECHAAFPNLDQDWETVLESLDAEPALLEIEDPESGETHEARLERRVWAESLRSLLYGPGGATAFPYVVHRAAQGDFDPFVQITLPRKRNLSQYLADGLYLSVTCAEDVPYLTEAEIERRTVGTASERYRIEQQQRACRLWPRGEMPEGTHEPVETDLPVLLLSGAFDPVTPPSYGEQVAAHMPNGLHVLVPEGHHGYDGLSNQECIAEMVLDFVQQASFEGLDTSCVDSMERPPFVTSAEMLAGRGEEEPEEDDEG